jgi:hypothetical protein
MILNPVQTDQRGLQFVRDLLSELYLREPILKITKPAQSTNPMC